MGCLHVNIRTCGECAKTAPPYALWVSQARVSSGVLPATLVSRVQRAYHLRAALRPANLRHQQFPRTWPSHAAPTTFAKKLLLGPEKARPEPRCGVAGMQILPLPTPSRPTRALTTPMPFFHDRSVTSCAAEG